MDWLLLRGLAREQRHWWDFPERLAARPPGARVHLLDLPGTGTEHARRSPADIDGIMGDVRARWLALRERHAGPWRLLGISLGGMVAMQWCARHPEDFAGVVLANTSAADVTTPWRRISPRSIGAILRAQLTRDLVERERLQLAATVATGVDVTPFAQASAQWLAERPITRANAARQLFAAARYRAPARLAVPVLVVCGRRDPLADAGASLRLAERFDAALAVHPAAGHDLSIDAPDWLAAEVALWAEAAPARAVRIPA
jgi:pimeloyl-ACP methyl ester carboxylesterase